MHAPTAELPVAAASASTPRHAGWIKLSHWIVTLAFMVLLVTGVLILMVHPRLYWGEVGNDLTPAVIELPISRNFRHGGWEKSTPFFERPNSAVTASRTYDIFNQNGWARSLHFLAGWFLVLAGAAYLFAGIATAHFWRRLAPHAAELSARCFWQEIRNHLRLRIDRPANGQHYGLLQRCAYCAVIFVALPLVVVTGLAMSPALNAAYPFLSGMFGGFQSARTVHFFASAALVAFLVVHVAMITLSGFRRQMRDMTWGKST